MGQFFNQPDFGTQAEPITPGTITPANRLNSAALYVGVGGDLSVIMTGTNEPTESDAVVFKAIPPGSFVPIIVDYVLASGTTADEIIALH